MAEPRDASSSSSQSITSAHIQLAKVSHMAEANIRIVESIIHNKNGKDSDCFP